MLSARLDYEAQDATVLEPFIQRAQRDPDSHGIVFMREDGSEDVIPAGRLLAETLATRRGLEQAGLRRGDVVIIALGHSLELIRIFLGCIHAGIVPTIASAYVGEGQPIDAHAKRLQAMAEAAAAVALIIAPSHVGSLSEAGCRIISTAELGDAAGSLAPAIPPPVFNDVAYIQYTSGTGGRAKGIALAHHKLLRFVEAKRRAQPIESDTVAVSWLPLYHDLGLMSGLLAPLVVGIESVLISPLHWVRSPAVLLRALHAHRGTATYIPNFALNHCVRGVRERDLEGLDLSCVRTLVCGGEMMRADSIDLFTQRFAAYGFRPEAVRVGYGMAELVEGCTVTPPGRPPRVDRVAVDSLEREQRAEPAAEATMKTRSIVSCGAAMPGSSIRIVDADDREVADRCLGEVVVRGDFVVSEYYRQTDHTAPKVRDNWFHTGDVGYIAEGELFLTGRKSDLIIVGGRNIQPEEIESIADDVPGLRPGRSVAFGVADAAAGSERIVVVAEVAAEAGADLQLSITRELRRRCTQQLDATLGDVRLVDRGWVIKSSSGKHARPANREKYLRQFGGSPAPA